MAGLFSPSNTPVQDDVVASAVAAPIRLYLENLTREQVMEVLYWIGYCRYCGVDLKKPDGTIEPCCCTTEEDGMPTLLEVFPISHGKCPSCGKELKRVTSRHKCRHGVWCGIPGRSQQPGRSRTCIECNQDMFARRSKS